MLRPIESSTLSSCAGIRHGFFTRQGGISLGMYGSLNCGLGSNDDPQKVLENRGRVAAHLGARMPEVVTIYQVHGATAVTVEHPVARDALPVADAIVTRVPGLAIGVLTADCTPVLLADPDARVVAVAHAGWRGAKAGIVAAAVAEMERQGADRARIRAAIGPCISQASYEVGPEFEAAFRAENPENERFFRRLEGDGRPRFDLTGFVLDRVTATGVAEVDVIGACTYENESQFFSYRRSQHRHEPDYGRQISAIVVT